MVYIVLTDVQPVHVSVETTKLGLRSVEEIDEALIVYPAAEVIVLLLVTSSCTCIYIIIRDGASTSKNA